MGKKFVLSDLDGTLLNEVDALSDPLIAELNELIENGLDFTIATGRDLEKAKKALPGLNLKYPAILTNGAVIGDLNTMQYLHITVIPQEVVNKILELSQEYKIPPMVFAAFDSVNQTMHFNKGKWGPKYPVPRPLNPGQYLPYADMDVVSIQFHTHRDQLDTFKDLITQQFEDQVNLIYIEDVGYRNETGLEGWFWLEINSIEAGKANGVKILATKLGIDLKDMIVFGDNYNDMEMLQVAGKGIAVANAPDEVKTIATEICDTNFNGGVIRYLQDHIEELL